MSESGTSGLSTARCSVGLSGLEVHIGALIVTYTILGVPYYKYSIMGPKTVF